jgi:exopolyphosphatase/guanosine-5'-triphosphate,3'-diphosphate pyrophosphatase
VGLKRTDATISFVHETAKTYDPDPAHSEQVTTLALALFDGLGALHGYGPAERRLLEIAGRLHDIGWSRVVSGKHHKLSRDMILELDIPGLDKREQGTCALIVRYHTKAPPDASRHRGFASLETGRRELVEWLAGMLRVADGLDCSHARAVEGLACEVSRKAVVIHLQSAGDCRTEIEGARQKHDLLEAKAGRRIEYRC